MCGMDITEQAIIEMRRSPNREKFEQLLIDQLGTESLTIEWNSGGKTILADIGTVRDIFEERFKWKLPQS
jgi:hypothetical protein